ncbi:hypothetical protein C2R22_05740 [Salinigranum rubrum]|uniref:Uncharacterized protein n=1 Tax=Salinigranum rubrum TaxID=755307 RepID=A0A2I8VH18_9EURY|nr:hypothetical protein [Salinigranum rubrum]AUV81222.1 hypothetical protein C2R22_05740 [Salinigranum rubrum]
MIGRGPDGNIHTWRCSAREHYRLGGRGLLCWLRAGWGILPRRLRAVLGACALVMLAFGLGALTTVLVWWLYQGVV